MRKACAPLWCCLLLASVGTARPPEGFTSLFNGTDLDGWKSRDDTPKHWRVEKGELIHDGAGKGLSSERTWRDVELRLEYRTAPKAKAVLLLRGGRVELSPAPQRWNAVRLVLLGERATVEVNGEVVSQGVRLEHNGEAAATLQLSASGGEVRWRELSVRELGADEATRLLCHLDKEGFQDVFNGKDFTGWAGVLDNYEIKDGAIVCKPKKGGNIFTKEVYDDFAARVEFQLPAGGNNGLAIRYPGTGQASVVAMCEIQILDDTAKKYAKLDPRQFNGAVYGMIAPKRGALRPVGEWNFMEVRVKGHTIQIEVNGTRVVDGDVSKVTEFMGGKAHPGKDRLSGHFGFCGHNDPVAFRNIQIKPLRR